MDERDLNVYGHNQPDEKCETKDGIREKSVGQSLEDRREDTRVNDGGMGRKETPKDEPAPGEWHHSEQNDSKEIGRDRNPRPPLHAPLSDEEPS